LVPKTCTQLRRPSPSSERQDGTPADPPELRLGVSTSGTPGDPITLGADRILRVVDVRDQDDDEPTALVLSVVGLVAGFRALRSGSGPTQGSARGLEPESHLSAELTLSAELGIALPVVGR
jgi:hypothetical protein